MDKNISFKDFLSRIRVIAFLIYANTITKIHIQTHTQTGKLILSLKNNILLQSVIIRLQTISILKNNK